ncbi:MAG: T9SS type A sorting domain-containing protein, partial [Syntrophothermus sp.]
SYKISSGVSSGSETVDNGLKVYPNPFNSSATISFSLMEQDRVNLDLFNILGQKVKTITELTAAKGSHQLRFDAADLPAGIYILRINAGQKSQSVKIMHLK